MEGFEKRGTGAPKQLYLHGYDELTEAVDCAGCSHRPTRVYRVSYDGVEARYTLCGLCFSEAKRRWGVKEARPAPG